MARLRILLFRNFELKHGAKAVDGLSPQKIQELLCYLLLQRDRPHNRETIASSLWQNGSLGQAKKNLRQVLWQIQVALHEVGDADETDLLQIDNEWLRINTESEVWLDVAEFGKAFEQTKHVRGSDLTGKHIEQLERAVALYRGQLLEGWFYDWCIYERERLHDIFLSMLEKLLGYSEAHNDYGTGITYGSMILRWDPARERTHRRLMRLQYATGRRTEALRQYQTCADALCEELGVEPGRSTNQLYQQIRHSQPVVSQANDKQLASPQTGNTIDDAQLRLQQLNTLVSELQDQLFELQILLGNQRNTPP